MVSSRSSYNGYSRICALLMVGALLFSAILGTIVAPRALFATEASDKRAEAAEAGKKAAEGQKQVDALKSEIKTLDQQATEYLNQAAELEPKIESASTKTEKLTHELRTLEDEAEVLRSRIAATAAEYSKQQELAGDRMAETYKQGDYFFFELLLSSSSFMDLITRFEYVQRTIEANVLYARDLDLTRRSLETDKVQLDVVVAEAAVKQKEAADAESSLRTMQSAQQEAASNAEAIQAQKTAKMQDTQKNVDEWRAIEASLYAEAMAMLGNLGNSVEWGSGEYAGTFTFPVGGSWNDSCGFGCGCSIHGGNHQGKDFGTGGASPPALAAAPGRVVMAGWNGGYGNFVSIDHGNGVVTQYAHLNTILVSVGQTVSAGQPIGYIGSTGFSFGNHLHFEVVINGAHVNPMNWL